MITVRCLALVESDAEGFPFQPGQVIRVPRLTPTLKAAVRDGRAEIVRDVRVEAAINEPREQAITR